MKEIIVKCAYEYIEKNGISPENCEHTEVFDLCNKCEKEVYEYIKESKQSK